MVRVLGSGPAVESGRPGAAAHALVDSNSDACRNGIVDIIRMATNVLRIIREDYCLSPSVQPLIFSDPPSVRSPTFSVQPPTFSNSPSVQPPTFLDPPSMQPSTFQTHY